MNSWGFIIGKFEKMGNFGISDIFDGGMNWDWVTTDWSSSVSYTESGVFSPKVS